MCGLPQWFDCLWSIKSLYAIAGDQDSAEVIWFYYGSGADQFAVGRDSKAKPCYFRAHETALTQLKNGAQDKEAFYKLSECNGFRNTDIFPVKK